MKLLEPSQKPEPLRIFPVVVEIPVQWGDQDAYQHVNNVISLRWFETARIAYFQHSLIQGLEADGMAPILAQACCNFRQQVKYPDTVLSACRISRVGGKSLTMDHAIYSLEQQLIVSDGTCITVMFDYNKNESMMVIDQVQQMIETMEARVD